MVVICPLCKTVQRGNSGDKCNQIGCIGKLEEAFKCNRCDTIQRAGDKCIKPGCVGGELKRQKQKTDQPTPVRPSSHVVLPTASEQKVFAGASGKVADKGTSHGQSATQLKTTSSQESGAKTKFRAQLEAQLKTGPPTSKKLPTKEIIPSDDAPKILKSEIPIRTAKIRDMAKDVQFVTGLMKSAELRKIVIINMLQSYGPSEGAKHALKLAEHLPGIKDMAQTMMILVKDAHSWDLMGLKAFNSGFAACQQCVAIMFHKLVQNPLFSSCIQLVHVPGHHFLVFGERDKGDWKKNRTYIVDLWLQNLHRPKAASLAQLGDDNPGWSLCVTQLLDPNQTYYLEWLPKWEIDLTYDPLIQ